MTRKGSGRSGENTIRKRLLLTSDTEYQTLNVEWLGRFALSAIK